MVLKKIRIHYSIQEKGNKIIKGEINLAKDKSLSKKRYRFCQKIKV